MFSRIRRLLIGPGLPPASYEPLLLAEPLAPVSPNPTPIQAEPILPEPPMATQADALMNALDRLGADFAARLDDATKALAGVNYASGAGTVDEALAAARRAVDDVRLHAAAMTSTAQAVASLSPAAARSPMPSSGISSGMTDQSAATR